VLEEVGLERGVGVGVGKNSELKIAVVEEEVCTGDGKRSRQW